MLIVDVREANLGAAQLSRFDVTKVRFPVGAGGGPEPLRPSLMFKLSVAIFSASKIVLLAEYSPATSEIRHL